MQDAAFKRIPEVNNLSQTQVHMAMKQNTESCLVSVGGSTRLRLPEVNDLVLECRAASLQGWTTEAANKGNKCSACPLFYLHRSAHKMRARSANVPPSDKHGSRMSHPASRAALSLLLVGLTFGENQVTNGHITSTGLKCHWATYGQWQWPSESNKYPYYRQGSPYLWAIKVAMASSSIVSSRSACGRKRNKFAMHTYLTRHWAPSQWR
eukprot:1147330-Pelagomonas_calceolata.AAC.6